jgi:hypothetical protein
MSWRKYVPKLESPEPFAIRHRSLAEVGKVAMLCADKGVYVDDDAGRIVKGDDFVKSLREQGVVP